MSRAQKHCIKFSQFAMAVYFLLTGACMASSGYTEGRRPANFVPDDDMIIVPMVVERNFIQDFHEKHSERFQRARKKLEFWLTQEQYAIDYGLEDALWIHTPSEDEKQKFMQRNYLRFISKDLEKTTNKGLENTWERWTADDEIESINALEEENKVLIRSKKSRKNRLMSKMKEVKVGKDRMKFDLQVRPEIGMANLRLHSKYFEARAWVGINGNQELIIKKKIKKTGTAGLVNYYIDEERLLAAVDQYIIKNWSLRFTHEKSFDKLIQANAIREVAEENILKLRYSRRF